MILDETRCYITQVASGAVKSCAGCYMRAECPIAQKLEWMAIAIGEYCHRCPDGPAKACVQPGCKLYPVSQKLGG